MERRAEMRLSALSISTVGAAVNVEMFAGSCDLCCCREGRAHSLGQLHFDLLPDLLPLLVAADREDVPVLQLLLAGSVPELHRQQFLPDPAGECPWKGRSHRGAEVRG